MLIVLDANAVTPDYHLQTPSFHILAVRIAEQEVRVCIPMVAVIEIEATYRRAIDDRLAAFHKWLDRTNPLGPWSTPAKLTSELDTAAKDYPGRLARRLSDIGIEVLPIPSVDLEELVRRATSRRRPFNDAGNGFRDNLIWHTVLELADANTDEVVFVSNDKAFWDDGNLHPDLLEELTDRGLDARVSLIDALPDLVIQSLLDRKLTPGESLDSHANTLRLESIREWVKDAVVQALSELEDLDEQAIGLSPYSESATIEAAHTIEDLELEPVSVEPTGDLVAEFSLTAGAVVEFIADEADEEAWDFHASLRLDFGRCWAELDKTLDVRGLVVIDGINPISLEVTEVRAPEWDPIVQRREAMVAH